MRSLGLSVVVAVLISSVRERVDLPIAGLPAGGFGTWTMNGDAFRPGSVNPDLLVKLEIVGARDQGVLTSEIGGDGPRGTLTSGPFKIDRDFVSFLIAGGDYERSTCLDLLVDGAVVRSATGRRSDHLAAQSWDVRKWRGKQARLRLVDQASGDWGHITVDRIVQTDRPEKPPVATEPLYGESLRPQFHFTARQWTMDRLEPGQRQEGWINDLNGLIYYDGEYHLFAQRWAKCWLHAVSEDLVHWTELAPAFWEEQEGSGVQSGTCVVDYGNTSGLSDDPKNPAMVAFWSRFDNRSQCISYSLDHGRTWTRYAGNPIFTKAERDPKVFWYTPADASEKGHWVMMMYGDDKYHVLISPDLLHWTDERHPIAKSFECPDFFQLPVDGDKARMKWVLVQGDGNYSIGTFDGRRFTEEGGRQACDVGPNFYATQSWHNTDTGDGRRIQVAWMRGSDFPGMPFSQQISFPCELTLHQTPGGLRLFRRPIEELKRLQKTPKEFSSRTLRDSESLPLASEGDLYRLEAEVEIPKGSNLVLSLRGESVVLTADTFESGHASAPVPSGVRKIDVLLDRGSIETFVNDGEVSSTRFALPKEKELFFKAEGGPVTIRSLKLSPLRSVWPKVLAP